MANEFTDSNVTGTVGLVGDIKMTERADHLSTPAAGLGILWTKNTTPSTLIFTDDAGTDTTVGAVGGATTFSDSAFRVQDNGDATKQLAFEVSAITTGTTRTITMPDTAINLADIAVNTAKVSNATHTGDVTGSTVLTIAAGAIDIAMHSATGTADATTFYRGDNTWATPAGGGDMSLAGTQTVTGAKSFNDSTLILKGSTSGTTTIKANATAGTTTATFQAATGIVALTADIPADTDDLAEGATNKYATAAEKTKVGYLTVTQAVNLDTMESDIATLMGGPGGGVFDDSTFRIQDNVDNSKEIAFQASGISAGTVRTVTMQDASGTMAYLSNITGTNSGTNTGDQTITLTGDVTGTGTGTFAATLDKTAVTGRTQVSVTALDEVLITDQSDSGNLKRALTTNWPLAVASTDNAIARFDSTAGQIQDSVVTIADTSGNMAGVGTLNTHTIPGGTGTLALTSDITVTASSTNTLTNKRITLRSGTTASSATPTINTDNIDLYIITAQAEAITSMTTNLSGTPVTGDQLWIWITGTAARGITWGASFSSGVATLPTTTVTTTTLYTHFIYDGTIWRCMATGSNP